MSNLDVLFDKLRKQPKTPEDHWKAQRQEWLDDLEKLWATIAEWLQKGVDERLVRLERRTVELVQLRRVRRRPHPRRAG
jgi:hypothetical protein